MLNQHPSMYVEMTRMTRDGKNITNLQINKHNKS